MTVAQNTKGRRTDLHPSTLMLLGPRTRPAAATSRGRGLPALAVLAVEALDAARGIDELLLAGEERMAGRADLDVDRRDRGPGLDDVAARAGDDGLLVLRMNAFLHDRVGRF